MLVAAGEAAGRHLQMVYFQYPIPVFTQFTLFSPDRHRHFLLNSCPTERRDLPAMLAEEVAGGLPGARLAAVTRAGSGGPIYGVPWLELV
jgi:hypothetical protein